MKARKRSFKFSHNPKEVPRTKPNLKYNFTENFEIIDKKPGSFIK